MYKMFTIKMLSKAKNVSILVLVRTYVQCVSLFTNKEKNFLLGKLYINWCSKMIH